MYLQSNPMNTLDKVSPKVHIKSVSEKSIASIYEEQFD